MGPDSSPVADPASEVWALLQEFVRTHDRRPELGRRLGFGPGAGRGRMLLQLRHGPLTLRQLAEANGFDAPYTTLVVDKLERRGLVERIAHPHDRRRKLVRLTPAGHEAVATADSVLLEAPTPLASMPSEDLVVLGSLLAHLTSPLEPIG